MSSSQQMFSLRFLILCFLNVVLVVADSSYSLTTVNPSVIVFGDDLNRTVLIIPPTNQDWTQINGLFNNLANTSFWIIAGTDVELGFSQADINKNGPRGLRVQGPISVTISTNSSQDFYLTFSLYYDSLDVYDNYVLAEYSNVLREYQYTIPNSSTTTVMTVINKLYYDSRYFEWDLQKIAMSQTCVLDIYVGGHPGKSKDRFLIYSLNSRNAADFVLSTLRGQAYTFILSPSCQASFSATNTIYSVPVSLTDSSHGFVASREYPGDTFLPYADLSMPFQQRLVGYQGTTYSISGQVVGVDPGTGGNLTLGFYLQNKLITQQVFRDPTNNISFSQSPADEIRITWSPSGAKRNGFLVRYQFGSNQPDVYSIVDYSLIFDSRKINKKQNRITCPGCTIQVNAISQPNPKLVTFKDNLTTVNLEDILDQPAIFSDYVEFDNVDGVNFVAAFTPYTDDARAVNGLDSYTIRDLDTNNGDVLVVNAKNVYQAVTLNNYLVPFKMWIGNITMTKDCEVPLYVGGVPANPVTKEMMRIFTFKSSEASTFSRSGITPGAATLLIPPKCAFKADFPQFTEGYADPLTSGSSGFMMSGEYPGFLGSDNTPPLQDYEKFALSGNPKTSKFQIVVPMADPGDGGQLVINKENLTSQVFNKTYSTDNTFFEVSWKPSSTPRNGFLLRYQVTAATKTGAGIKFLTLMISFLIFIATF